MMPSRFREDRISLINEHIDLELWRVFVLRELPSLRVSWLVCSIFIGRRDDSDSDQLKVSHA